MLFKPVLSRRKANRHVPRKNNRKFIPWHVISPPCLYQILCIFKPFNRFPTIFAIGVPFPLNQELSSAVSLPVVKNTLNFPLLFVINEDRRWFSMSSSRESFIVVRVVGLDY